MKNSMKCFMLAAMMLVGAGVFAQELTSTVKVGNAEQAAQWQSIKGLAKVAPNLKQQDKSVVATVVDNGNYQGLQLTFPQPVDLAQVKAITFDFYQTVRVNREGSCAIILYAPNGKGFMGSFKFGSTPWSSCQVAMDAKKFVILGKDKTAKFVPINKIIINMYRNLNRKGQSIGVKNFTFVK